MGEGRQQERQESGAEEREGWMGNRAIAGRLLDENRRATRSWPRGGVIAPRHVIGW
jgi:hypothetical protein